MALEILLFLTKYMHNILSIVMVFVENLDSM